MAKKARHNRRALLRDIIIAITGSALGYAFAYRLGIPMFSFSSVWLILVILLLAETAYYVGGSAISEARHLASQGPLPSRAGSPDFDVRSDMRAPSQKRIYGWIPGEDLARSVLLLAFGVVVLDLWFAFTRPDVWPFWVRLFVELPVVLIAIWIRYRRARYLSLTGRGRVPRRVRPPRAGTR